MAEYFEFQTRWGLRIAACRWHAGAGNRVLALHGWLDNLNSFLPLAPLLQDHEVVAVDFPGHGKSDKKPGGYVYHFIDSVADVLAMVDGLGWDTFDLIGHSMGAGVAPLVAATIPERVQRMICLEGLGPLSLGVSDIVDRVRSHNRQLKRLQAKKFPVYRSHEEALMARLIAGDISSEAGRMIVERSLIAKDGGYTWNTDARLRVKSAHPFTEEQVCAYLKGIVCPTLVVRASPGYPFDQQEFEERRACLSQVQYREISGKHHVHMDQPQQVAALIGEFYDRFT